MTESSYDHEASELLDRHHRPRGSLLGCSQCHLTIAWADAQGRVQSTENESLGYTRRCHAVAVGWEAKRARDWVAAAEDRPSVAEWLAGKRR